MLGHLDGKLEQTVEAKVTSYTDAKSGQIIYASHAKLGGLHPNFAYLYGAMHDGAEPEFATFRTSPRGRTPFMFTSLGDQGTPTLGKKFVPPEGVTIKNPPYVNDHLGSPAAGDTTLCCDGGRALTDWGKSDAKGGVPCNEANCFGSFTVARASTASPVGRKNTARRLWRCRVAGEMLLLRWMLGLKAGSAMYRGCLPRVHDGA